MTPEGTGSLLSGLECPGCGRTADADAPATVCPACGGALFATYRLDRCDGAAWARGLAGRPATLWRYRELLPVRRAGAIASLGEGFSPVLPLGPVPAWPEGEVWVKDEGGLPTGSFKARGMAVAVSRARELGMTRLFVPSAGNAGVALAAYAARAGLAAAVYLPQATPEPMVRACRRYGARVVQVPGTIREAGLAARAAEGPAGGFDVSTLREPYRAEGKKTMGLEIWEQFRPDRLPDAIVYPTGGGTGLVGMHRAFEQLRALGLLERAPRLLAVQPEGCAPVVRALGDGAAEATPWTDPPPRTIAPGLLVPAPFSSGRILEAVRRTGGAGVTVSDAEILAAGRELARRHGLLASPEGAAPYAALPRLAERGLLRPGERVLLLGTGSGLPFLLADDPNGSAKSG
ncbi:MAG: threonine synthase [Thermoplasmata archaeon]